MIKHPVPTNLYALYKLSCYRLAFAMISSAIPFGTGS